MHKIKVGLLPLYLALYDQTDPQVRPMIDAFGNKVCQLLKDAGLDVVCQPVCRISEEFEAAVARLNETDVCAVITLHLAYSPSLESVHALSRLHVPVIVMDTTPDFSFDQKTPVETIMYNHGIHGVQDLCNRMLRSNIMYFVEAGHIENSDLLSRVEKLCIAADAALHMKNARVGLIGKPFAGMGDFQVPEKVLKARIGMEVVPFGAAEANKYGNGITQEAIKQEILFDQSTYQIMQEGVQLHQDSTIAGLTIRRWIKDQKLTALSVNFMDLDAKVGLGAMPVLEIDKGMTRGVGYAGEGDVLTAALCGALFSITGQLTFTEMFCPDWKGRSIFLSHMAEVNPLILANQPVMAYMAFPYTAASDPAVLYGRYQPGQAVLVNLAPITDTTFRLILVPGKVNEVKGPDALDESVHGWFSPDCQIEEMLKSYSMLGGTHHLVMLYGDVVEQLEYFGRMMSFEVRILKGCM